MQASKRREWIQQRLSSAAGPVSASALAEECGVSRQIIVGDVALMRAAGAPIAATPRGYVLQSGDEGLVHTIACIHPEAGMERELQLCVDNGCAVLDVVVEHPVYGQLTAPLQIASRYDLQQFLDKVRSSEARPLSLLTDGVHLHRLRCPDEESYRRVCRRLEEEGFLWKGQK